MKTTIFTTSILLGTCGKALATGGVAQVYTSGLLVMGFFGVCAIIVVLQMIPAIITAYSMVRALFSKKVEVRSLS